MRWILGDWTRKKQQAFLHEIQEAAHADIKERQSADYRE
jgi:hypothetical protein